MWEFANPIMTVEGCYTNYIQVKSWEDEKLFSVPGGVLIKTTLVKSLAKALLCTQASVLIKTTLVKSLAKALLCTQASVLIKTSTD